MINQKRKIQEILDMVIELNVDDISTKLKEFKDLVEKEEVIEYAYIAEMVYVIPEEKLAFLNDKIDEIKNKIKKEGNLDQGNINLLKILENIKLDLVRRSETITNEKKMNKFNQSLRIYKHEKQDFTEKLRQSENNIERTQSQIITILSIFAGIIIAFFGGISLLGSAIENFNKSNKFMTYALVIVVGLIMFNVIYLLLYTISKLVQTPITISKCKEECCGCDNINPIKQLVVKYPLIVYFNISAIWGIFLLSMLYLVIKLNVLKGVAFLFFYLIYFLVGIIILVGFLWWISRTGHKDLECNLKVENRDNIEEFSININEINKGLQQLAMTEEDDKTKPRN